MKHLLIIGLLAIAITSCAQKQTFDLATYTAPKGWKKQTAEHAVQFVHEDTTSGAYCIIMLFKAVPGKPASKDNFDAAWTSIVKEMVTVSEDPEMQPAAAEDGWELQSGTAAFETDGNKGVVLLVTATGFERMVNALILTNSGEYEGNISGFLESITLKKPAVNKKQPVAGNAVNTANAAILGTWGKTSSNQSAYEMSNGLTGYIKYQYTFNSDGTYTFYTKTFQMALSTILLVSESGTYTITGETITIEPKRSQIESWNKKNGVDAYGTRASIQNRQLEKVTYKFYKHYFEGIQEWNLVMEAPKQTIRDGIVSSSSNNVIAYYFKPVSSQNPVIDLPK